MKVLGIVDSNTYLVEVGHTEIEKFLDLYYGKLSRLKVGEIVDLGRGYDYARDIRDSMKTTRDFVEGHQKVVNAIINGLRIENLTRDEDKPEAPAA